MISQHFEVKCIRRATRGRLSPGSQRLPASGTKDVGTASPSEVDYAVKENQDGRDRQSQPGRNVTVPEDQKASASRYGEIKIVVEPQGFWSLLFSFLFSMLASHPILRKSKVV